MRPKIVSWHDKQCKQLLGSRIKLRNFEISDYVVKRIPISLNEQQILFPRKGKKTTMLVMVVINKWNFWKKKLMQKGKKESEAISP